MRRYLVDAAALLVLAAVVAAVFWSPLSGRSVFGFEDFLAWYLRARLEVGDALRHGGLAQWDPWSGLGQPLVANPAASVLYPLNLIQAVGVDDLAGLHRLIVFHLWLGGAFTYVLARGLGCRVAIALMAGLSFAFAGVCVSYAQENPYQLFALAWVPLALHLLLRAIDRGRWRWAAGAALPSALILFAGDPQTWFFNAFLLGFVALAAVFDRARCPSWRDRGAVAGYLALAVGGGVVLSFAQLWATMVGLGGSARGAGFSPHVQQTFSMPPLRLLGLWLPYVTGVMTPDNSLWGIGFTDKYRYWTHSIYAGLWVVLLAPAAFARSSRRLAVGCSLMVVFSALLALGRFAPFYELGNRAIPGMSLFRYPEKWAAGMVVPLIVLGALGGERILRERRVPRSVIAATLFAVLLGAAAVLSAPSLDTAIGAVALYPDPAIVANAVARLRTDGAFALAISTALAVPIGLLVGGWLRASRAAWLLAGVATIDVVLASLPAVVLTGRDVVDDTGPLVAVMQSVDPAARFVRVPYLAELRVPVEPGDYQGNQRRAVATGSLNSLAGVQRSARINGPPVISEIGELLDIALDGSAPLDGGALYSTRFYIVADRDRPPDWIIEGLDRGRLHILLADPELRGGLLEDRAALPRVRRVEAVVVADDGESPGGLEQRLRDGFPFATTAIVDDDSALVEGLPARVSARALPDSGGAGSLSAELRVDERDRIVVDSGGAGEGLLVVNDAFAPGWTAAVNGEPAPIHRVNFGVRGVYVPAGPTTVTLTYEHPGLDRAIAINLGLLGAWALLLGLPLLRRRRLGNVELGS